MKLLIIGGTRLLGKAVVERLIKLSDFDITILSRKAGVYKDSCVTIEKERKDGLEDLLGVKFDVIIDFIAYDKESVQEVINNVQFNKYILISSCWMPKISKNAYSNLFIDEVDELKTLSLPPITLNYLLKKRDAENYLRDNISNDKFIVLRLPIFWGLNDHTQRLDFYLDRLRDSNPVFLVDKGLNNCQISNVPELARLIEKLIINVNMVSSPIIEALPVDSISVYNVVKIIADACNSKSEMINVSHEKLKSILPEYLDQEPLWREVEFASSDSNIYKLLDEHSEPILHWLTELVKQECKKLPKVSLLRTKELDMIKEII